MENVYTTHTPATSQEHVRFNGETDEQSADWIAAVARLGYAVKGVVYSVVGLLAVQAAMGAGGSTSGAREAIREIGRQPFGQILLIVIAAGLVAYSTWRFYEAFADPDDKGADVVGLVKRAGFVVSGFTYLLLAFTAGMIVIGSRDDGGNLTREWTAIMLSQPFGQWAVATVGAVVVAVGLYHFYRAYKTSFVRHYDENMSAGQKRWAKRIGRFGLSARGVTFVIVGSFFIQAARQASANEVRGLGGALETLAAQPYGKLLLGTVAAGFIAYGIYCFSRARYRRFETAQHS